MKKWARFPGTVKKCSNSNFKRKNKLSQTDQKQDHSIPAWLVGFNDGKKIVFSLDKETTMVGRSRSNDVTIRDRFISRKHLLIQKENSHFNLIDLGTRNCTSVNNKILSIVQFFF